MIKTGFSNVPKSIVDFINKVKSAGKWENELVTKWQSGKISQEQLNKPYIYHVQYEMCAVINFASKDEIKDLISDYETGNVENCFGLDICDFKSGAPVEYSVEHIVTIKE